MAREVVVGTQGLRVPPTVSGAVDVLFDGQRVWSFSPEHDGTSRGGMVAVEWPKVLRHHLDGVAEVDLVEHVSGEVLATRSVQFGSRSERVRVVDAEGNPLAVDKGGRLQRDFSNTTDSARDEIMDALEAVLADLVDKVGLDAYLMYGCLLGAIRDGHMIGHDSDADVAYLSRHEHPFDIVRECTAAMRQMRALGWKVVKMSGANFKVWVPLPDGRRVGIDVFGSFHVGGRFHVTGSLTGELDRAALLPFGTVTLEGREIVAPADPEAVLEFTYGPGWRVPDPAFHFDHAPSDVRRMDAWFRAARRRHRFWQDFYKSPDAARVPSDPSPFAHWVDQRLPDRAGKVLDVGAGTGRDSAFFARQGRQVVALDVTMRGLQQTADQRRAEDLKVPMRSLNFEDVRSVLLSGARFAHQSGTRQVYARGLLDTLGPVGRANLWRFASMVQRNGGETFLEFRTPQSRQERKVFGAHQREYVDPDHAVTEIEAAGGTVTHRETGRGLAPLSLSSRSEDPHICRLVVRWS